MSERFFIKTISIICIAVLIVFSASGCGKIGDIDGKDSDSGKASPVTEPLHSRDYYSSVKGNGQDDWTFLIYMNAEEVEEFGAASKLISQLAQVELNEHITIIIQTFGTDTWKADFMKKLSDRILFSKDGISTMSYEGEGQSGNSIMLKDFASESFKEFDNNRKAVIFWGRQSLNSDEIADALEGHKLDFIAFDTQKYNLYEDAYNLRDAADYLIATSSDYSISWDFSHFFYILSRNSSYASTDIAKLINESALLDPIYSRMSTTPSIFCVDLTEMSYVHAYVEAVYEEAESAIANGHYSGIALARAYSSDDDLMVDAGTFISTLSLKYSAMTEEALKNCISYASSNDISLSLYLPIHARSDAELPSRLSSLSHGSPCEHEFIKAYLTAGMSSASKKDEAWFDDDTYELYNNNNSDFIFDEEKLVLTAEDQTIITDLSEEEGKIYSIRVNTYVDTGEYFIKLGDSPVNVKDDEGHFIVFQSVDEWFSINSQNVSTFSYTGFDEESYYLIPSKINDVSTRLIASSDEVIASITSMGVFTKTDLLKTGDIIEFYYPVVSYNSIDAGELSYGFKIAMANELQISQEKITTGDIVIQVILTDIAGNEYKSEFVNVKSILMDTEPARN